MKPVKQAWVVLDDAGEAFTVEMGQWREVVVEGNT